MSNHPPQDDYSAAKARLAAAEDRLNHVLAAITQFEPAEAQQVMDLAQRILRLALKGEHLGPFALTLAGVQMAVDLSQLPAEEAPVEESPIIRLDGSTLQ